MCIWCIYCNVCYLRNNRAKYHSKDSPFARKYKLFSRSSMHSSMLVRKKKTTRSLDNLHSTIGERVTAMRGKRGEGVAIVSAIMRKGQTQFVASQRIVNRLGAGYATTGACATIVPDYACRDSRNSSLGLRREDGGSNYADRPLHNDTINFRIYLRVHATLFSLSASGDGGSCSQFEQTDENNVTVAVVMGIWSANFANFNYTIGDRINYTD